MRFAVFTVALCALASCSHQMTREPSSDMHANQHAHMKMQATPVKCESWSDTISPEQQAVINAAMGSREHRLHHALWHSVRGGLEQKDQHTLEAKFGPTWAQAHALCPAPQTDMFAATYNPAGEDFLYMHRNMIEMLRAEFASAQVPCIKGFEQVPSPKEWPLPDKSRTGAKSNQTLALLQAWDQKFRDPVWLKSHSLSQVGWSLEFSLHNNMHMRYATELPPKGFDQNGAPISVDGTFPASWNFDDPKYNWLADPYGAALNPTFWKIHGYVDSIIDGWLKANDFDMISDSCGTNTRCYEWKGKWTGELALSRDLPKVGVGLGSSRPDPALAKRRIDLQRIGVLKDSDFAPPTLPPQDSVSHMPRAPRGPVGPSSDPYDYTLSKLCP
jgi:hypothetical protein